MTTTVSISDFRDNISDYLEKVSRGVTVIIKDEKKGKEIAQVTPTHKWDPVAYEKALRRAAGVFSVENHPEWATLKKVEQWLRKTRMNSNRKFKLP